MFVVNMNDTCHTHEEIKRLLYNNKDNKEGTIIKNRLTEYSSLLDNKPAKREHIYKDYIVYV